jgi:hypothetical protein
MADLNEMQREDIRRFAEWSQQRRRQVDSLFALLALFLQIAEKPELLGLQDIRGVIDGDVELGAV